MSEQFFHSCRYLVSSADYAYGKLGDCKLKFPPPSPIYLQISLFYFALTILLVSKDIAADSRVLVDIELVEIQSNDVCFCVYISYIFCIFEFLYIYFTLFIWIFRILLIFFSNIKITTLVDRKYRKHSFTQSDRRKRAKRCGK